MTRENSDIMEAARLWMIRTNSPDFTDWNGLSDWLDADPGHLAAYEAALDDDAWVQQLSAVAGSGAAPAVSRLNADGGLPRVRRREWLAAGAGIAAVLVAVGTWTVAGSMPDTTHVETGPGERRSIALADGTRVEMNGESSISFDADAPRMVTIQRGEAVFEVRHDEKRPFVVQVGKTRLIDAGTIFNVIHDGQALEVAVAEGLVIYDAGRETVTLKPGDALTRAAPGAPVRMSRADPGAIGSWRSGVLQYDDAPLATIARDLARAVGRPVRVSPSLGTRRFDGTLALNGPAPDVFARAGPLLGVTFLEDGKGWEMTTGNAANR